MTRFLLLIAGALTACTPYSETIGGAAPAGTVWVLQSINDVSFEASATMKFAGTGSVAGLGPCNSYSAKQKAPLPWFETADFTATKRNCPSQAEEKRFFDHLVRMDFSEIGAEKLLLTNSNNETMLFVNKASIPQS